MKIATIDGAPADIATGAIGDLRARLRGRLLIDGDHDYDRARVVFNGLFDRRPALIAQCADAADVAEAVRFAAGSSTAHRRPWRRPQHRGALHVRRGRCHRRCHPCGPSRSIPRARPPVSAGAPRGSTGIPETHTIDVVFGIHGKAMGIPREQFQALLEGMSHTRRSTTLDELANVAVFLASDLARGMTGTVANITGGRIVD